jgi:uncharacterized protein DUF3592
MNDLWLSVLLGGLGIAGLIWVSWKFLPWVKLLRKGVLVEGRIEAHHSRRTVGEDYDTETLSLVYSYDCNETNYLHEEVVSSDTYSKLKDGDRVKVRCLPEDPTTAELETSAFLTLWKGYMNIRGIPVSSHENDTEKWTGD